MLRRPVRLPDAVVRALGLLLAAVALGMAGAAFALAAGVAGRPGVVGDPLPRGHLVVDVAIVAAGVVLVTARPRNLLGWVLLALALLGTAQNAASVYGTRAASDPGAGLPLADLALSLGASLWVPALFLLAPVLVLLYPSGRLPSPRWRWVVGAGAAGALLLATGLATSPAATDDFVDGAVPAATLPGPAGTVLQAGGGLLALAAALAGIVGTLTRTARSRGRERQQLLWLLVAAATVLVLALVAPPPWLLTAGLALVPLAVAVGVLAFGLLGIETVLRRTLLYGVLTGLVLAVYVGATAAVSAVVPAGPVPAVVAAALVAGLLSPARSRLQRWVDRLVRGAPADPLAAVRSVGAEVSSPGPTSCPPSWRPSGPRCGPATPPSSRRTAPCWWRPVRSASPGWPCR